MKALKLIILGMVISLLVFFIPWTATVPVWIIPIVMIVGIIVGLVIFVQLLGFGNGSSLYW